MMWYGSILVPRPTPFSVLQFALTENGVGLTSMQLFISYQGTYKLDLKVRDHSGQDLMCINSEFEVV